MADSCHTPCKGRKASCTRPRCAASWLVPADASCRWREPRKATGACEAVFLGKSFQGCVPCHSLILPPASGCRLYHPASLQKRPDVPALCTPRSVVRRPSPAPVIRAVTQQHVALGRQHLGRGNRRSSSPESPQLLCTHRGCSQTMREAIWDMSWGWCAFTADVGVLKQGGAKCGDRLTCAAPARLVQHVAYAY